MLRRISSARKLGSVDYKVPTSQLVAASTLPTDSIRQCDALVLGCGVAGSAAALRLAAAGMKVTILSAAKDPSECNSYWAQGGIIYKAKDDSPDLLASDIHRAGAGMCYDPAVQKVASEGPSRVEELLLEVSKVPFETNEDGELALTLEASHNRARILFKADHTGKVITNSMQQAVLEHPNIEMVCGFTAFDLAMDSSSNSCAGALVIDNMTNEVRLFQSKMTVLATGGLGDLYLNTSNPEGARGEGVAMAARAGAKLKNMQYVQFHPTTLYIPNERRFLLTEALRGEGAKLCDKNGNYFAKSYHPMGELAPRDVVARMILSEMEKQNEECMYLDITHMDPNWIQSRFPTIYAHCLSKGIDMTTDFMPIVPAAHYHCGGVKVDLNGMTSVHGLYAAGEVSCTGMHGANRLASTSLLEALVWGCAVSSHYLKHHYENDKDTASDNTCIVFPSFSNSNAKSFDSSTTVSQINSILCDLQHFLWDHVGARRTTEGMLKGVKRINQLETHIDYYVSNASSVTLQMVRIRNAVKSGKFIAEAAYHSPISVGTHYIMSEDPVSDHSDSEDGPGSYA